MILNYCYGQKVEQLRFISRMFCNGVATSFTTLPFVNHSVSYLLQSFPLCPFCFSHPPLDGMKDKSGCNQCTHPTCKHSVARLSVMECDACDGGVLVLEPFTAPKWLLSCNK